MRRTGRPGMLPLAIAAILAGGALLSMAAMATYAMTRGDWGTGSWGMMGNGHMQRMMGGGTNTSNATPSVGTKTEAVAMRDLTFTPGNLQVPVGATVTFTNYDAVPHTATARDGSWDTGLLNKGESKAITFDKAGDYEYYCTVHPNMVARLTVR
jgi:plastocyanin